MHQLSYDPTVIVDGTRQVLGGCQASSLSLPGQPPWTVTISKVMDGSQREVVTTFNSSRDWLYAHSLPVYYSMVSSTVCGTDFCSSLITPITTTDELLPALTSHPEPTETSYNDGKNLSGAGIAAIVGPIVGASAAGAFLYYCLRGYLDEHEAKKRKECESQQNNAGGAA
jgi:hypothetical protein